MKKLLLISVFGLIMVTSLFCDVADGFLLGNYSYWQGKDRPTAKYETAADSVFQYMVDCGYNTTICNAYLYEDIDTKEMLTKMKTAGLQAILTDFSWDGLQTDDYYSTRGLSLSNYQTYEAEYRDGTSVTANDGTKDIFYYRSRGDESLRGVVMPDPTGTMSNGAYIKCDPSVIPTPTAGYVYDGFVYRWDTQDTNNPTDELKKEFQFVKLPYEAPGSGLNAYIRNNTYVYVTVAFQCPDDEEVRVPYFPHDLITLDIIDPNASDPNYERIPFVIGGDNLISHQAIINDVKYRQLPSDSFNNRLLTVKIPLSTFYSKGMLAAQDSSTYVLSEFNVRVYWHGNSLLYLDYIEIEDSIHKKMKNDATIVSAKLNNRIDFWNQSIPAGTIKFFYGFDEPNQPQFDSYKIVQDMIDSTKPNIVSAVYDWQRKMEKSHNSANPDPLDQFYQHQIAFIEKATPKYFAPDLYPIVPNTVWNDEQDEKFVQTLIDKNLLCRYNEFKMRTNSNDYKFYPVVQSFGEWVAGNQWESWLRPPAETQKMLQYLPLCYQADGIINYIFPTFTNGAANNAGQYGPLLIVDNGGALSYEPQTNYYALKEANSKILHYHKDISESEWLWAENLAVNENNPEINLTPALLYSLYINPSGGIYQGYVQCGLYNKAGQPQFMLVNRRANYLRDGFVPQSSNNGALDNCFSVPLPQKVHFIPDASAHNLYGTHIAMYDPYDSTIVVENSGTMEVNIGPGDGMLLQMCGSLPAVVETDAVLRDKVYLSGEILISNLSKLSNQLICSKIAKNSA